MPGHSNYDAATYTPMGQPCPRCNGKGTIITFECDPRIPVPREFGKGAQAVTGIGSAPCPVCKGGEVHHG